MRGFRQFLLRGNVIDLATGIAIGVVFTAFINGFVKAFLTPLVGAVTGGHGDFSTWGIHVGETAYFPYGDFINATITLVLTAIALYYIVILPANRLTQRFEPHHDVIEPQRECPKCLSSIPVRATRCSFCTADLPAPEAGTEADPQTVRRVEEHLLGGTRP